MVIISFMHSKCGKKCTLFLVGNQQWSFCVRTPSLHLMVKITSNTTSRARTVSTNHIVCCFYVSTQRWLERKVWSCVTSGTSHNTLKIILIESPWKKFWYQHLKSVLIVISTRKRWGYLPWMEINRPWIIKIWKKHPHKDIGTIGRSWISTQ